MRRIYKHIPNTLTSLNLLCGSLSVMFAIHGDLLQSAYLLLLAFHFDIFDGLSARLLNVKSDLGKELDSLADIVSFGVGPAALLFAMLMPAMGIESVRLIHLQFKEYIVFIPFIIPVFAALRLAKFNLIAGKSDNFSGMPTPANALMVLSIPLIANNHPHSFLVHWFDNSGVIIAYALISSYLMVSPLQIYSFKLKGFKWSVNKYTFFFLAGVVVILVIFGYSGLFLNVVLYIIYGTILAFILNKKANKLKR